MERSCGGTPFLVTEPPPSKKLLLQIAAVFAHLIGLIASPWLVLKANSETLPEANLNQDVEPTLLPCDTAPCAVGCARNFEHLEKQVEETAGLTMDPSGIEQAGNDVRQAVFVRSKQLRHAKIGSKFAI
jgi:hypothetical protein